MGFGGFLMRDINRVDLDGNEVEGAGRSRGWENHN